MFIANSKQPIVQWNEYDMHEIQWGVVWTHSGDLVLICMVNWSPTTKENQYPAFKSL